MDQCSPISSGFRKKTLLVSLGVSCLLMVMPVQASKEELKGVKGEISRQQTILSSQQEELNKLQKSLKQHELSISSLTREIKQTQKKTHQSQCQPKAFSTSER